MTSDNDSAFQGYTLFMNPMQIPSGTLYYVPAHLMQAWQQQNMDEQWTVDHERIPSQQFADAKKVPRISPFLKPILEETNSFLHNDLSLHMEIDGICSNSTSVDRLPAMEAMDHLEIAQNVPENTMFCSSCFAVLDEFSKRWEATPENYSWLTGLMCQVCLPILNSLPLAKSEHVQDDNVSSLAPSAFRNAFQFAVALRGDAFLPSVINPRSRNPSILANIMEDDNVWKASHTLEMGVDNKLTDDSAMSWKFSTLAPLECGLCRGSNGHPIRTRVPCSCKDDFAKPFACSPLFGTLGHISTMNSPRLRHASLRIPDTPSRLNKTLSNWSIKASEKSRGAISHYIHSKSENHLPIENLSKQLRRESVCTETVEPNNLPAEWPHAPYPLTIYANSDQDIPPSPKLALSKAALKRRAPRAVRPCKVHIKIRPSKTGQTGRDARKLKRAQMTRKDSVMSFGEFVLTPTKFVPATWNNSFTTIYAQMTERGIPWCRFCGATTAPNWRPGPWGRKSLCNKHGCAWGGHSGSKRVRLDLTAYEDEPLESRIIPVMQEYCWQCQCKTFSSDNRLHRCFGCQKSFHTRCLPNKAPRPIKEQGDTMPWFCSPICSTRTIDNFVIGAEAPPLPNPLSTVSLPVTRRPCQKRKRVDASSSLRRLVEQYL